MFDHGRLGTGELEVKEKLVKSEGKRGLESTSTEKIRRLVGAWRIYMGEDISSMFLVPRGVWTLVYPRLNVLKVREYDKP